MNISEMWKMIKQFFASKAQPEQAPKRFRLDEERCALPIVVRFDNICVPLLLCHNTHYTLS